MILSGLFVFGVIIWLLEHPFWYSLTILLSFGIMSYWWFDSIKLREDSKT